MTSDFTFTIEPSADRRAHPRYEILAQVRFKRGAITHVLDVSNISLSGLFVADPGAKHLSKVRVGEELELDVFASEELENVNVKGRVVRIVAEGEPKSWGFGVHFLEPGAAAQAAIVHLVEQAAAHQPPRPPPLPGGGGRT